MTNNLKHFEGKKIINISDTDISSKYLSHLISHLPKSVENLNLSGNKFNKSCVLTFDQWLPFTHPGVLKVLNLSGSKCGQKESEINSLLDTLFSY